MLLCTAMSSLRPSIASTPSKRVPLIIPSSLGKREKSHGTESPWASGSSWPRRTSPFWNNLHIHLVLLHVNSFKEETIEFVVWNWEKLFVTPVCYFLDTSCKRKKKGGKSCHKRLYEMTRHIKTMTHGIFNLTLSYLLTKNTWIKWQSEIEREKIRISKPW